MVFTAESIDAEFAPIFEEYAFECSCAIADYYESCLGVSYMEKKKDNDEPKGIVGVIMGICRAIINLIKNVGSKIKSLFTGCKVDPAHKNTKIKYSADINALAKLYDEDIDSCAAFIKKHPTVEEANGFIKKRDSIMGKVVPIVTTVGSLFAACEAQHHFLEKWKKEVENVYDDAKASGDNKWSEKYSRQKDAAARNQVADEGSKIIMDRIQSMTQKGIVDCFISPVKTMFQKGYIKQLIIDEGESSFSKKGAKAHERQERKEIRSLKKAAKEEEKVAKRRDKHNETASELAKGKRRSKDDLQETQSRHYNDVGAPDRSWDAGSGSSNGGLMGKINDIMGFFGKK